MPRYRLLIEYDGAPFVGWQRQDNGPSVQQFLEEAAFALSGEKVTAFAAGRTDAGVHALGMVAHIDLCKEYGDRVVRNALNQHLRPHPIAILEAACVDDDFHARFSCVRRAYEYRIVNRSAPLALERNRVWHVPVKLDVAAMHSAAQHLVGRHDFTTFRATQCQAASPIKTLEKISVSERGDTVVVNCAARSFLHHQVRSIVGSLVDVGRGRWSIADLVNALEAADRAACGRVAPADGLYFVGADYDETVI